MSEVKYLTKEQFQRLNDRAIKRNANRTVKPTFVKRLSEGLKFPIIETLLHNDVEMRCCFATHKGDQLWLDISFKEYEALPSFDIASNDVV